MKTFIINYRKCIKLLNTTEGKIYIYIIIYLLISKILYKDKIKPLY